MSRKLEGPMAGIDLAASYLAYARKVLCEQVGALEEELAASRKRYLAGIKRAVGVCAERHAGLRVAIENAPGCFVRPRTVVLHGIKLGLAKGKGGIVIEDPERTVGLIRKIFDPKTAETLIITKEAPSRDALKNLPVSDLKRIGCEVKETGDYVVISFADSEVDKVVNALLADATATAEREAA